MRRALVAVLLLLGLILPVPAGAVSRPAVWSKDDAADLDRVSAYLNSFTALKGAFTQIGPNGDVDQGTFYISKPGKMRFDYRPPAPTMVVSDGISVIVYNTQLKTADRYPLSMMPINVLLSSRINLKTNKNIVGVARQTGTLIVYARSNDRRMSGNITIVFAEPSLELRQWTVVDAQGLSTTISVHDMQTGVELSPQLFGLKESKASAANTH